LKSPRNVTIREVAERAGVSTMTVSRVMRNEPSVTDETRAAVRRAVAELNYEPLLSARNLASNVAKVVGLVVPHTLSDVPLKRGYEYLSALHLGAIQVCKARDYGLMLVNPDDEATAVEQLVRNAKSRRVGGYVVAAPATEIDSLLDRLRAEGVVFSALSPGEIRPTDMWVGADERAAARALTLHMIEQGHHEIAYIGGAMKMRAGRERYAGYLDALKQHKIKAPKSPPLLTMLTFEAGCEAASRLLEQDWLPSAVCCETDDVAAGVMAVCHSRGMRLPQDLSVVGFDNFGLAHKIWPSLTTAHLPVEEMAAYAAEQVINALEGQPVEREVLLPCPIHYRESVSRPAQPT